MYFIACPLYFNNINEKEREKKGSVHQQIDPQGGYRIQGINAWLLDGMCG